MGHCCDCLGCGDLACADEDDADRVAEQSFARLLRRLPVDKEEVEVEDLQICCRGSGLYHLPSGKRNCCSVTRYPFVSINNSALYWQTGITDARRLCHGCMTHLRSGGDPHEYAKLQVHDFGIRRINTRSYTDVSTEPGFWWRFGSLGTLGRDRWDECWLLTFKCTTTFTCTADRQKASLMSLRSCQLSCGNRVSWLPL